MQPVSPVFRRFNSSMRELILSVHVLVSLSQSRLVGTRSVGSLSSSSRTSASVNPTLWAKTMNATRLTIGLG